MAKRTIKAKVADIISEPRRIEALKMGEIRIGMSTLNAMNKVTARLINLVYSLEGRISALESKKG